MKKDIIRTILQAEIDEGQAAYEMMMDGYGGDFEAYLADYAGDFHVTGCVVENQIGQRWIVTDDGIEKM